MTISEITEVPSDRRNESRAPSPHTTSSISVRSPGVNRRSRYQATPPNAPATSSTAMRRPSESCSTAACREPAW